jgi:thiol-disulfide isomerase/thioredoxin
MKHFLYVTLAVWVFVFYGFQSQNAQALVAVGKALPEISLPDTEGRAHSLNELTKDKVSLIVYWSVSCPHCRVEMPKVLNLAKQLKGNPFTLIMVNADGPEMKSAALKMAEFYGIPEPVLLDNGPEDTMPLADAFDLVATPSILVLDRTGKMIHAQEVEADMEKIKKSVIQAF